MSGFLRYRRGLAEQLDWELVTPDAEAVWWEDVRVRLRHVSTGKFLSVTEHLLPEWGGGTREVAGASSTDASYWRVGFSRPPRAGTQSMSTWQPPHK